MTGSSSTNVPLLLNGRRGFLLAVGSGTGLAFASCASAGGARAGQSTAPRGDDEQAEVTPGEDLMQEHGVLERILLIYDESARRIEAGEALDTSVLTRAAEIVRSFVEDYHEKQEEEFVFPRLQQAGRELDLIGVLLQQHRRGREVTDDITRQANSGATPELARSLRGFSRMYRPHASREETVLIPAFRDIIGRNAYRDLGEQFEDREHERFGEHGFEDAVKKVAELERALGIFELSAFTP